VLEQSPACDEVEESSTVAITVGEGFLPREEALQPVPSY
jgi:hypothetical protein